MPTLLTPAPREFRRGRVVTLCSFASGGFGRVELVIVPSPVCLRRLKGKQTRARAHRLVELLEHASQHVEMHRNRALPLSSRNRFSRVLTRRGR